MYVISSFLLDIYIRSVIKISRNGFREMIFIGRTIVFLAAASREIHFLEIIAKEVSGSSLPHRHADNPSASERRVGKKASGARERVSRRDPLLWKL